MNIITKVLISYVNIVLFSIGQWVQFKSYRAFKSINFYISINTWTVYQNYERKSVSYSNYFL